MALPTLEKTWEINANISVGMTSPTPHLDNKDCLLKLVNGLIGFTNTPCTVWGSSDSVACGNGDSVNRWLSSANIVHTYAGPNSWIVLNFPGIGAKTAICIHCNTNPDDTIRLTVVLSPGAGFGAANGGTDGTTSARPTATDQSVKIDRAFWGGRANDGWTGWLHFWHSTDGECTRIAITRASGAPMYVMIDKSKDPEVPGWDGFVCVWLADAFDATKPGYNPLFRDSANYTIRHTNGVWYSLMPGVEWSYWASSGFGYTYTTFPLDVFNEWPIFPVIGLWGTASPIRCKFGSLYDHYYTTNSAIANGDSFPNDGSNQFWCVGNVVLPGNGSALNIT